MTTKIIGAEGVEYPGGGVQKLPSKLLGMSYAELVSSGTGAGTYPLGDTVPQSNGGNEILTVTHTRLSATSRLHITVSTYLSENVNQGTTLVAALFQDAAPNAIAAQFYGDQPDISAIGTYVVNNNFFFTVVVPSGAIGPTTLKLRGGVDTGAVRWNGAIGGRTLGGAIKTNITVMEIES